MAKIWTGLSDIINSTASSGFFACLNFFLQLLSQEEVKKKLITHTQTHRPVHALMSHTHTGTARKQGAKTC